MKQTRSALLGALLAALCLAPPAAAIDRDLTFEERVAAQAAIERVRYAHALGATQPFEAAVPRQLLEAKVETYLRQGAALERRWNTPVTTTLLERELRRIAAGSRMPGRLRELFAALGGDAFLIQECLVRPLLVDRLARQAFDSDHDRSKLTWDAWWAEIASTLSPSRPLWLARGDLELPPLAGDARPCDGEAWVGGALASLPTARTGHTAVWTGTEMLVWGGNEVGGSRNTGARYDPSTDTWTSMSTTGAPTPRSGHAAVWTGSLMIVWGQNSAVFGGGEIPPPTGGRYDPLTDTWSPTTLTGAPQTRSDPTAVWTGSVAVFWGGYVDGDGSGACDCCVPDASGGAGCNDGTCQSTVCGFDPFCCDVAWDEICADEASTMCSCCAGGGVAPGPTATGGRYDPANDTWLPVTLSGAPSKRSGHVAVWAGSEMIVWGGLAPIQTNTGGRYDPVNNYWTATPTAGAPAARWGHSGLWTGTEMIVWGGGSSGSYQNNGGRYNLATNSWTPTNLTGAPSPRGGHDAIWTGSAMLVWGGVPVATAGNTGARYDPGTDSWTPTATAGAPAPRQGSSMIWTGSEAIVWGGDPNYVNGYLELYDSGGRYDPIGNSWIPTFSSGAPSGREGHSAVWTGNQMIVWGGGIVNSKTPQTFPSGGRYDPATDSWTPTKTSGAPGARVDHTAVWSGSRMIVWGGRDQDFQNISTGGRYDPIADSWSATSLAGAPQSRNGHTAVWTGTRMIVWGGAGSTYLLTGGQYNPTADTWTATTTTGVPAARESHTAVWTGSAMIVWGGLGMSGALNSGALYNPTSNTWTATTLTGAPPSQWEHVAVWTGNQMLVWGGGFDLAHARYDPVANAWTPMSLPATPVGTSGMTAVWGGKRMIVWGGLLTPEGGSYDPVFDAWQPTTTVGAPQPRWSPSAVWTGGTMIVWGGGLLSSGGIYDIDGTDFDGDGVGCALDCNDGDATVFGSPGELRGVRFQGDKLTLTWPSQKIVLGNATAYDVARGAIDELPVGSGAAESCLAQVYSPPPALGSGLIKFVDAAAPAAGEGLWYLVRSRNPCGIGSYGTSSPGGEERVTAVCP